MFHIHICEVYQTLASLNPTKTPGVDNINHKVLKACANVLTVLLRDIFNQSPSKKLSPATGNSTILSLYTRKEPNPMLSSLIRASPSSTTHIRPYGLILIIYTWNYTLYLLDLFFFCAFFFISLNLAIKSHIWLEFLSLSLVIGLVSFVWFPLLHPIILGSDACNVVCIGFGRGAKLSRPKSCCMWRSFPISLYGLMPLKNLHINSITFSCSMGRSLASLM